MASGKGWEGKCGLYGYIRSRRKTKKNVGPLLNKTRDLMTKDAEKTETLNAFFDLISKGKTQVLETSRKVWRKKVESEGTGYGSFK